MLIVSVFAAIWAIVGLAFLGAPVWSWVAPVAISAAIIWSGRGRAPVRSPEQERRTNRSVLIWSAVEGVAIFVAVNLLINFGLDRLVVPAVGLIVGLHLLPLAYGLGGSWRSATFAIGLLIGAISVVAATLPGRYPPLVTAFGAAASLWSAGLLRRAPRR